MGCLIIEKLSIIGSGCFLPLSNNGVFFFYYFYGREPMINISGNVWFFLQKATA